jgi:hypothetical protein
MSVRPTITIYTTSYVFSASNAVSIISQSLIYSLIGADAQKSLGMKQQSIQND